MVERGGLWLLATPGKQELWTCEHDGDLLSKKKLESKKYLGIHSLRYVRVVNIFFIIGYLFHLKIFLSFNT